MKDSALSVPKQKNYEYSLGLAYDVVREKLAGIVDIEDQCRKCGATYRLAGPQKIITLSYLNQSCQIFLPENRVSLSGSDEELPPREKLLVLHYFVHARGTPLSHKTVSFKELAEGKNYFRTFHKRTIQPLVTTFAREPQYLLDTAKLLGGRKADYGDVAVTIDAFDRVPITFILWQGDEEFPPEGNVMFDSTIADYLPGEDIIVLSEILAWKLVKGLKK